MPLTLRDLAADSALGLTVRSGAASLDRRVDWVHGSELDDPTPFLEGGELLLTTGLTTPNDGWTAFVQRLAGGGVAGLGFGTGLSHRTVPKEVVRAAENAGLALLEVPRRTPFIAITKAISRAVAEDEYAGLRWANRAQHELATAAGRGDRTELGAGSGVAAVVRRLARLLNCWTLLLDPAGTPLHASSAAAERRAAGLAGKVARLRGRATAGTELDGEEVSLRALGTRARGVLAVGRREPWSTADHHVLNSAASLLTLALEQRQGLAAVRRRLRSGFFALLQRGGVDPGEQELGELRAELPGEPFVVVAMAGGPDGLVEHVEDGVAASGEQGLVVETAEAVLVLAAPDGAASEVPVSAAREHAELHAGVSAPCDYSGIASGQRQALRALSAARRGQRDVLRHAELAGSGLWGLLDRQDAAVFAGELLRPLLQHDRAQRGDLVGSLRAWLDMHGQWDPAAQRLGVHRHTLRNRIDKAARLLDRDLDQPGVRAELWIALQVDEDEMSS